MKLGFHFLTELNGQKFFIYERREVACRIFGNKLIERADEHIDGKISMVHAYENDEAKIAISCMLNDVDLNFLNDLNACLNEVKIAIEALDESWFDSASKRA
jgi:hypothetical protein